MTDLIQKRKGAYSELLAAAFPKLLGQVKIVT